MLLDIVSLLLDIVSGLITGACLLRLYMQMQRIPFANPMGRLVFALTDWLVMPLRKIVPSAGRWDLSCLIGAYLAQLVEYAILTLLSNLHSVIVYAPLESLFGMARVALSGMMMLLIVNTVLSWVQAHSPISVVMERLCEPLLRPVRRYVPLMGGIDFSPLVVIVILQVLLIVLNHLRVAVLSLALF
ncbi:YggT family protein [Diaphorobacter aerolatus]|uniref:YggT family protein n=1 Tax=Diaphorobacter aerolatus TaxID=1288495 RepID=A0A7H0GN42_9BURK|nr:YggT family protein [Diaphorobacter aerolatus]QNP49708.1 YggT family protein [Diaphorobacter aerolatus]